MVNENVLQNYLRVCTNKLEYAYYKRLGNNGRGTPDSLIIYRSNVYFIELKKNDEKSKGRLSKAQRIEKMRIEKSGGFYLLLYGKKGIDDFFKNLKEVKVWV